MLTKVLCIGGSLFLTFSSWGTDEELNLRYAADSRYTNVYHVAIETSTELGKELIDGNITVVHQGISSGAIELGFRGSLRPQWVAADESNRARYQASPYGSYALTFGNESYLKIDAYGQVLGERGEIPLNCPLGGLMRTLVEPLPAVPTNSWERSDSPSVIVSYPPNTVIGPAVLTAPITYGTSSPYNRSAPEAYPVKRHLTYVVTNVSPQTVTIAKHLDIESMLHVGEEPKILATADGEAIFDRKMGALREVSLKGRTLVNSETLQRRQTINLSLKLLEGDARDRVLNPPAPVRVARTNLTEEQIQELTRRVISTHGPEKVAVISRLSEQPLTNPPPELIAELARIAANPTNSGYYPAISLLAKHCDKTHAPLFLEVLNQKTSARSTAIAALGRLGDKRAITPLCNIMAEAEGNSYYGYGNSDAAEALIKIGPDAEAEVLNLLKTQKSIAARCQACNVLREIGTKRSLSALQEAVGSSNTQLSEAAAKAIQGIQNRR